MLTNKLLIFICLIALIATEETTISKTE